MDSPSANEFEQTRPEETEGSFLGDLFGFMSVSRKWWLLPLVAALLLLGLLILFSSSAAAPFIYTLF